MHPTLAALLAHGPVLTDGAWGTQLQARGLPVGDFPDAWNLSHPDAVREVAAAYLAAGSQLILTNTFGANRLRLAENGLADQVLLINRRGVELSRQAASGRARVFASIGPTGKLLMNGDVTEAELSAAFQEQAQALAEAGADGLVIETMADLTEATLAVQAAKATGLPVVGCMVFDSGKNKDRTLMGVTPEQAATALAEAGADVVGANCGQGIAGFVSICQRMRAVTDRPLWMKANAGLPVMEGGRTVYHTTPDEFARFAPELARAGAAFIGGCCGTSPAFIQALRAALPPAAG
ncbi:homocysteine S-methyltransferase family protein [Fontisphaera persica]|uniref:homocysteine S-methyltransferase family protein n=1 Tax=Fontisphaera persica TaxID=2974023 RepID=UPI0024C0D98F|nr:homocysteine S-methyltransferase family protein [Fontisphaera persica]WCJ57965.1 homocysteine S-methyltransferase family protein [Fontisphaera persica]